MATVNQDDVQQEVKKKLDFSFSVSHLRPLKNLKTLGFYTKNDIADGIINTLILDLEKVFSQKTIIEDNKKIDLKINGESQKSQVTTENKVLSRHELEKIGEKNLLFTPADYVNYLLHLLIFFREEAQRKALIFPELTRYSEAYIREFFRDCAGGAEIRNPSNPDAEPEFYVSDEMSRYSFKVKDLLQLIRKTHDELLPYFTFVSKEEEKKVEGEEKKVDENVVPISTIAEVVANNTVESPAKDAGGAEQEANLDDLSPEQRSRLQRGTAAVHGAAYYLLISKFLEDSGLSLATLPPELRQQFGDLDQLLKNEILDLLATLSPEELGKFLEISASQRMAILGKLLNRLYNNPNSLFLLRLQEAYKASIQFLIQTQNPVAAKIATQQITLLFDQIAESAKNDSESGDFEKIRQQVSAWISAFQAEIRAQEKASDSVEENQVDINDAVIPAPPVKFQFQPEQARNLEQNLSFTNLTPIEQIQIQNQSARMVWGSLAQLFEDPSQVPPHIQHMVSAQVIEYIINLSPAQRKELLKNPIIALLNHIGILTRTKLFENPEFNVAYKDFFKEKTIPTADRNQLIKQETLVVSNAIIDALFTSQNINDETVPDQNGLQADFNSLKLYIQQTVGAQLFAISLADLQNLSKDPQAWEQFFKQVESLIGNDPIFKQRFSRLIEEYIAYLVQTNQLDQAERVKDTLDHLVKQGMLPGLLENKVTVPQPINFVAPQETSVIQTATITPGSAVVGGAGISRAPLTSHSSSPEETNENGENLLQTTHPAIQKRKSILVKILEDKWNTVSAEDKLLIYGFYEYPIPRNLQVKNPNLDAVTRYCATIPDEFIGFDLNLLPVLRKKYEDSKKTTSKGVASFTTAQEINNLESIIKDTHVLAESLLIKQYDAEAQVLIKEYLLQVEKQTVLGQMLQETKKEAIISEILAIYEVQNIAELEANEAFIADMQSMIVTQNIENLNESIDPTATVGSSASTTSDAQNSPENQSSLAALRNFVGNKKRPETATTAGKLAALAEGAKVAAQAYSGNWVAAAKNGIIWLKNNKEFTAPLVVLGTGLASAGVAAALYGLSTIAGNIAFFATMAALGPVGLIPAILAADAASYLLPWGKIPFLDNIRLPPGPWNSGFNHELGETGSRADSLRNARAKANGASANTSKTGINSNNQNGTTANTAQGPAQSSLAAQQAANAAAQASGVTASATATAASSSSTGFLFLGLPIGLSIPIFTLLFISLMSITVVTIIMGAFLVPVPTRPGTSHSISESGEQVSSKYVDVTKVADRGKVKNDIPNTTDVKVTYTITITPKTGYKLKITGVKDTFSGYGESSTTLTSPLSLANFPAETFSDTKTATYSIQTGTALKDAIVTNAVTFSFEVYDAAGTMIAPNEAHSSTASIMIGEPKMGCWPTSGTITNKPFSGGITHIRSDAFDIGADTNTKIYAPFSGTICKKQGGGGYGNYLDLKTTNPISGGEILLRFGHLNAYATTLNGTCDIPVSAGQLIGFVGTTGNSTGPHLHYELVTNLHGAMSGSEVSTNSVLRKLIQGGQAADNGTKVNSCAPQQ